MATGKPLDSEAISKRLRALQTEQGQFLIALAYEIERLQVENTNLRKDLHRWRNKHRRYVQAMILAENGEEESDDEIPF